MMTRDELVEELAKEIAAAQNVPFVGARQQKIAEALLPVVLRAQAEALREAKAVIRGEGEPGHAGEFVSVNHVDELIDDLIEDKEAADADK